MANGKKQGLLDYLMNAVSVTALVTMSGLIGIQSHRAVSKVAEVRSEQHLSALRAVLTEVMDRQALHYVDAEEFAHTPEALGVTQTEGVVVALSGDDRGWAATASHAALGPGQGCSVFFGGATAPDVPVRPSIPGEVACSE